MEIEWQGQGLLEGKIFPDGQSLDQSVRGEFPGETALAKFVSQPSLNDAEGWTNIAI